MKFKIIIFLLLNIIAYSQNIKVIGVKDKNGDLSLPKIINLDDKESKKFDEINQMIGDEFGYTNYKFDKIKFKENDIREYPEDFDSGINGNVLRIDIYGYTYTAYPTDRVWTYIIDIRTGKGYVSEVNTDFSFKELFKPKKYDEFMRLYWNKGAKKEIEKANKELAKEYSPDPFKVYCKYDDIKYSVEDKMVTLSLSDDWLPHVVQGLAPIYVRYIDLETFKPYLKEEGVKALEELSKENYKREINFMTEEEYIPKEIPKILNLRGKIDGKYSITMKLNLTDENNVTGEYYYKDKNKKLILNGKLISYGIEDELKIIVKEYVKDLYDEGQKFNGSFELKTNKDFKVEKSKMKWEDKKFERTHNVTIEKIW